MSAEELQAHLDNADGMVKLSRLLHQREVRLDGREKAWLRVLAACAFSKSDSLAQDAALTWLRGERLEEDQVSVLKISATDNDAGADASDRQVNEDSVWVGCADFACWLPIIGPSFSASTKPSSTEVTQRWRTRWANVFGGCMEAFEII